MSDEYEKRRSLEEIRRTMLEENMAKDVRMYDAVTFMGQKIRRKTEAVVTAVKARERVKNKKNMCQMILALFCNGIVLAVIVRSRQNINAGEVVLYMGFFNALEILMEQISDSMSSLGTNRQPVRDYIAFVKKYETGTENTGKVYEPPKSRENYVVFEHVSFSYDGKEVFRDLNVSFAIGEKIAVGSF